MLLIRANLFDNLRQVFDRYYLQLAECLEQHYCYYMLSGAVCNLYYHYLTGDHKESAEELADLLAGFVVLG